jgi:hypothetical protein
MYIRTYIYIYIYIYIYEITIHNPRANFIDHDLECLYVYIATQADIKTSRACCVSLEAESDNINTIVGLFTIRMVNHMCDKGKASFEHKVHDSFESIRALFVKEIRCAMQNPYAFEAPQGWDVVVEQPDVILSRARPNMTDRVMNLEEVNGPAAALMRVGMYIGGTIREKAIRATSVYKISKFEFECAPPLVVAAEVVQLSDRAPKIINIRVEDIHEWQAIDVQPMAVTPCSVFSQFTVSESIGVRIEVAKHKLLKALLKTPQVSEEDLLVTFKPFGFYVSRGFDVGELKLTPKVTMHHMSCFDPTRPIKPGDIKTEVEYKQESGDPGYITIMKPGMPSDVTKWNNTNVFSPYFHIGSTSDAAAVTMCKTEVVINGITIPCWENSVPMKKYDMLQYYLPAIVKNALSNVYIPPRVAKPPAKAAPKGGSKTPPKPKAKAEIVAKGKKRKGA